MLAAMARRPQIEVEGATTAKTFERGGSEAVIEAAERRKKARAQALGDDRPMKALKGRKRPRHGRRISRILESVC